MYTPKNSFRHLSFFTLAGVSRAELQSNGQEIIAIQKNPLPEFRPKDGAYLCAEFANWPNDAKSVLRFTKRFGGLTLPLDAGGKSTILITDWINHQKMLRSSWDMASYVFEKFGFRNHGVMGLQEVRVEVGESFFCMANRLEYRARSLFRFVLMEFHSIPWERLRKCRRKDCSNPYFVARHLGQRYCSDTCALSIQREWKKQWWNTHGPAWRKKRLKDKK
jgi:hypothetical protein